jgi:hypothetical protein
MDKRDFVFCWTYRYVNFILVERVVFYARPVFSPPLVRMSSEFQRLSFCSLLDTIVTPVIEIETTAPLSITFSLFSSLFFLSIARCRTWVAPLEAPSDTVGTFIKAEVI